MTNCPLCKLNSLNILYTISNIPIFQNKVFKSKESALTTPRGNIKLCKCGNCEFVFNSSFDSSLMIYDKEYQNEQNHSLLFKDYLQTIINIIKENFSKEDSIVEIGCGKGYFLNLLQRAGFSNAIGIDPAYEGDDKNIIKDYYGKKYQSLRAKLIILRHTLEHIENPFDFLHDIARANNYEGQIYIEVPCFDWIVKKNAFWDIFYEHCNYFTKKTLSKMFLEAKTGSLFNEQYIYILANLKHLRNTIPNSTITYKNMDLYKTIIKEKNCIIWGAGAKGVTFLNIIDPQKQYIKYIVDVNPKKQGKYISGTSHKIISIEELENIMLIGGGGGELVNLIFIMNENYKEEIQKQMSKYKIDYIILGENNE